MITIEQGYPCPKGRQRLEGIRATLKRALSALKADESFVYKDNKALYDAAVQAGIQITTRKVDGGYRVWKRQTPPQ